MHAEGAAGGKPLEVLAAVEANEAMVCESLQLGHLSLASSGVGDGTEHLDNDHMCPICLVSKSNPLFFRVSLVLGFFGCHNPRVTLYNTLQNGISP